MGLAPFTRIIISAILLLYLALDGCQGQLIKPPFNAKEALALARKATVGALGPDFKTFNVIDYGAKPDGTTNNAFAFMKTFNEACHFNGNAMMVIPEGKFLLGSVNFKGICSNPSPLIVLVNGYILATPTLEGYPEGDWINFQHINGLILTGHGTFHGQGPTVWQQKPKITATNPGGRRPGSLKFNDVDNAIIRGITSIDAKGFHIFISNSENFRIFNIDIQAPDTSPNTDGIHMSKSSVVKISKSKIATGDDCVSMIHGCSKISIKKVVCGPGHGFSIGSLGHYEGETDAKGIIMKNCTMIQSPLSVLIMVQFFTMIPLTSVSLGIGSLGHYEQETDVSGILVKNCTMSNTDNGLRIKTYRSPFPSKASNIVFQDISMTRVLSPIIIDQEYGESLKGGKTSQVSISDVFFTNVRGTSASKTAVSLICSPTNPCSNIHLTNIDLKYDGKVDNKLYMSSCSNVQPIYAGIQDPAPCPR
ncbi:Glycoside hydrolase, family 28 [Corchorus olitorius]|uniref:Glycoside hydrolase, family 28 n=1 Tax=Corchorus olitorius TaxID=93759 RepID=A0A1R3JR41_9ROSI|nr:Glycoside hydrolase, family 28 [Corchorus olitorius]